MTAEQQYRQALVELRRLAAEAPEGELDGPRHIVEQVMRGAGLDPADVTHCEAVVTGLIMGMVGFGSGHILAAAVMRPAVIG